MNLRKLMLVGLIVVLSSGVQGQERGTQPSPSTSGGSSGGPGMSGAAVNTGTTNQGGAPNTGGGSAQPTPSGNRPGGGGQGQSGGAGQPTPNGNRPGGGSGQGPGGAQGQGSGTPSSEAGFGQAGAMSGGGFAPFSGEGEGVEGRFGGRGAESFSLDSFLSESGLGSFEELSTTAFQDQATTLSGTGQAAADEAVAHGQAAYDQLWADYYTAVDTTAQTYYDTATASADYALQTYEQAVDYTAQTVDSYLTYYEDYTAYCAQYSWDCYSYTYDSATSSYVYTGDTSSSTTTNITIGDVTVNGAYPTASAPTPSAEAYEALVVFANDQLGAVIAPLYAGAYTDDLQQIMAYLPVEMQAYVQNMVAVSSATYWGLWQGGGGAVMVGDCTANPSACAVNADNLSLQLSSASAGVYGLKTSAAMPTTPDEALQLITQVYPKFTGLAFAQVTDIDTGYAFTATTASMGFDPMTQQPVSAAKVIYAGVVSINGQAYVYTLVGVGEGYTTVLS